MKHIIVLLSFTFVGYIAALHDVDTLHSSLWAHFLYQSGKTQQAAVWYKKVVANATSLYSYQGLIHFLFSQKQFDAILSLIPTVDALFAKNTDIQKIFALSLYFSNKQDEALTRLIALNKQAPQDSDIAFITSQLLMQANQTQQALSVIDIALQTLVRRPTDFMLYYVKAQILITLSQFPQALEATKQCISLQSRFDKGWLLLAMLQEQMGNIEHAINGYTAYLDITSEQSSDIKKHLAQLLQKNNLQNKNSLQLSRYEKAVSLQKKSDFFNAEQLLTATQKTSPLSDNESLLLIDVLIAQKKYESAIAIISHHITTGKQSSFWPSILHLLLYSHAPITQLYQAFTTLEKQLPNHEWLSIYAADLALRQHLLDQALLHVQNGIKSTKEPTVKAKLLFQQAMILFEQRNFSSITDHLEHAIALIPNYTPALNLLAYYYAGKGKNIDRAWEYFNKITDDAHNPLIIDTKAYMLYKQGNIQQAHDLLKPIVDAGNSDATILIRYAKLEKAVGNDQAAKKRIVQAKENARYPHEERSIKQLLEKWT